MPILTPKSNDKVSINDQMSSSKSLLWRPSTKQNESIDKFTFKLRHEKSKLGIGYTATILQET